MKKPQMTRHQSRHEEGRDELRYEFSFPEYAANCSMPGGLLTLSNTENGPVIDLWRVDPSIEVRVAHEDPKTGRPTTQDRLAAAEPDLLEALREIAAGCRNLPPAHVDSHMNRTKQQIEAIARAAIARAEGQS